MGAFAPIAKSLLTGGPFAEKATLLLREAGARNSYGEWVSGELVRHDVSLVTSPLSDGTARARELSEAGIRISGARLFWTVEELNPAGDLIEWPRGDRLWQVHSTARHDGFSETVALLEWE